MLEQRERPGGALSPIPPLPFTSAAASEVKPNHQQEDYEELPRSPRLWALSSILFCAYLPGLNAPRAASAGGAGPSTGLDMAATKI